MVIGRFVRILKKSPSNTFEPNAYIGVSPTVKHDQPKPEHRRIRRPPNNDADNQRIRDGRIRPSRLPTRDILQESEVKPMWDDDIDWDDDTPAVREPDWQDEVEWE